jgi:hypothetical protein
MGLSPVSWIPSQPHSASIAGDSEPTLIERSAQQSSGDDQEVDEEDDEGEDENDEDDEDEEDSEGDTDDDEDEGDETSDADKYPISPLGQFYNPATLSYEEALMNNELVNRVSDIIHFVAPSSALEQSFVDVFRFIQAVVKKATNAEVFLHGSFALKTYLPDADLDVSAFLVKGSEGQWVKRVVGMLCQENVSTDSRYSVR